MIRLIEGPGLTVTETLIRWKLHHHSHADHAAEATTSADPPPAAAEHEYAETEINRPPETEQQSAATYTNTTPGLITQEAINHYDLGQ